MVGDNPLPRHIKGDGGLEEIFFFHGLDMPVADPYTVGAVWRVLDSRDTDLLPTSQIYQTCMHYETYRRDLGEDHNLCWGY